VRFRSRSASYARHVTPSTPGAASRLSAKNASRSRATPMWWRSAVNFSFFLSLAACRTRSSACDTRSRLCIRCVLCPLAFPLAPALCSTGSAASATDVVSALFVGFPAPIAGSDFSRSCIFGYGSSPPRRGPAAMDRAVERELSRFPETRSVCTCQGLRPRRAIRTLALSRPYVLPSAHSTASAPGIMCLSRLNGWPVHSTTDASPVPSRAPAHGSEPMRIATPSLRRTFTTYSLPVSPAHRM
jgi:hypothetical protein